MSEETATNWLEDAVNEHTDEGARAEAGRKDTIKKGRYRAGIKKIKPDIASGEKCPYPGRRILGMVVSLQVPYTDKEGNEQIRNESMYMKVSPQPYKMVESPTEINDKTGKPKWVRVPKGHELYTPAARFDSEYKNWAALEMLVTQKNEQVTVVDVLDRLESLEFSVYVSEQFKDPDGTYHKPKDDEERQRFLAEGWPSYNDVSGVQK